tara:strand:- start:1207 stop:1992 length:786 start_codon:yes stop_codon:yes gene_type:complete
MASLPPINPGVRMNKLKERIMNPSLSSFYSVVFPLPRFIQQQNPALYDGELLELSCQEASLPGSSVATLEQTNDYAGVTERHGYRRMYDETIDFTFLVTVNSNYKQIRFFDYWMKFITGEIDKNGRVQDLSAPETVMRAKYPGGDTGYRTKLNIVKYERDMGWTHPKRESPASNLLEYHFVDAYPKQISSSPLSYEGSSLMKTTVSMTYTRYFVTQNTSKQVAISGRDPSSSGNPEFNAFNLRRFGSELMGDFFLPAFNRV